jgi:hypothetical protein
MTTFLKRQTKPFPTGKLTVRWIQSRTCYQLYLSGRYVLGCSGDTVEDCLDEFEFDHQCPDGWRENVTETHAPWKV